MNPNDQQPTQVPTTPSEMQPTPPTQPEVVSPASAAPSITPSVPTTPQPAEPVPTAVNPLADIFDQIAEKIIEQQEAIIGPIAVDQARLVKELKVDWPQHHVDIEGSPQVAIDELVEQYKELFGQIAVETCREAASKLLSQLPPEQLPTSLKA